MVRIFIADDSEVLRSSIMDILTEIEGIVVIGEGGEAEQVIEAVDRLEPDILILDIRMAGGNGIQVLKAMKKKAKPPKIIMFTNYPYLQYRKKCIDEGADYFFYKATEFHEMIQAIKKLKHEFITPQKS